MEQASGSFITGIRAFSASSASHFPFVALCCSSVRAIHLLILILFGEYRCFVLAGLCRRYLR